MNGRPKIGCAAAALLFALGGHAALGAEPVVLDRVAVPIRIDGSLDELSWSTPPTLAEFVEMEPGDATPAPVTTEVWLGYDDASLYIAIRAHDPDPEEIV